MKIFISGDFAPRLRVNDAISIGDYTSLFNDMLPIIRDADFAITNLESPLIEYGTPIKKTGPNLKSPLKSIEALNFAGFDMVTLANNHLMDYGKDGLISTLKTCKENGIQTIGAGLNLDEAKQIRYVELDNRKIAFINCCENEWSTTHGNEAGCNPLDEIEIYYQIKEAKANSDYTILIIHGGHETFDYPSPRMKKLYRWFIDLGVDAVIGHHTHCFSGHEIYKGKPIVYSLGNFVFDSAARQSSWNRGAAAMLIIGESVVSLTLIPYRQCDETVGITLLNEKEQAEWNKMAEEKTLVIKDDAALRIQYEKFAKGLEKSVLSQFEPISNKYILAAINKGFFPSLLSEKKKRILLNNIRCESHRDNVIHALNQKIVKQ